MKVTPSAAVSSDPAARDGDPAALRARLVRAMCMVVGLGLLVLAAWLRPAPRVAPADRLRALARPLALPFLWHALGNARHEEPPEALAARGQQVLALLPQWTDGHIVFASELAFTASQRAVDPEVAADRILAALTVLEQAISVHSAGSVEYLSAMASFVEIRSAKDRAVAAALARRLGADPFNAADRYLARAEALSTAPSIFDKRTYLLIPAIESALRTGDRARALAGIERLLARLPAARDQALAARWRRALATMTQYLHGDPRITLASLQDDPLLHDMAAAIAQAPPKPRR